MAEILVVMVFQLFLILCLSRMVGPIQCIVLPCINGDILDFPHNAMSKVHYGHTTMSGIPEISYMIHTKIVNMLLLCQI